MIGCHTIAFPNLVGTAAFWATLTNMLVVDSGPMVHVAILMSFGATIDTAGGGSADGGCGFVLTFLTRCAGKGPKGFGGAKSWRMQGQKVHHLTSSLGRALVFAAVVLDFDPTAARVPAWLLSSTRSHVHSRQSGVPAELLSLVRVLMVGRGCRGAHYHHAPNLGLLRRRLMVWALAVAHDRRQTCTDTNRMRSSGGSLSTGCVCVCEAK